MAIQESVSPVNGGSGRTRESPSASLIFTRNVVGVCVCVTDSEGGMLKIEIVSVICIRNKPAGIHLGLVCAYE